MQNFAVAVSAVIPLLLLTLSVETRAAMRDYAARKVSEAGGPGRIVLHEGEQHPRQLLQAQLSLFSFMFVTATLGELAALVGIPFLPSGGPDSVVAWLLLLLELLVVGVLLLFTSAVLYAALMTNSRAAMSEIEGPVGEPDRPRHDA